MKLVHTCPHCGKEHESEGTPEPDKTCWRCLAIQEAQDHTENILYTITQIPSGLRSTLIDEIEHEATCIQAALQDL